MPRRKLSHEYQRRSYPRTWRCFGRTSQLMRSQAGRRLMAPLQTRYVPRGRWFHHSDWNVDIRRKQNKKPKKKSDNDGQDSSSFGWDCWGTHSDEDYPPRGIVSGMEVDELPYSPDCFLEVAWWGLSLEVSFGWEGGVLHRRRRRSCGSAADELGPQ